MVVDAALKNIYRSNKPFGGMQMLFIGDPYQLPPALNKSQDATLLQNYPSVHFFNSTAFRELNPCTIALDFNYKVSDPQFRNALQSIRTGKDMENAIKFLNTAYIPESNYDNDSTQIVLKNNTAVQINNSKLSEMNNQIYVSPAIKKGAHKFYETQAEDVLKFCLGARVIFIDNKSQHFSFGDVGTITQIINENRVKICLDDGKTIVVDKQEWSWDWGERVQRLGRERYGKVIQFPFKLGWATTIHKSSGIKYKSIVCNIEKVFQPSQSYVAISKSNCLSNIH